MVSDGDVADAELAQLANLCSFSPIFARIDAKALMALAKEVLTDIQSNGAANAIERAKSVLTLGMRETSILFAMRIALADGVLDDAEKNTLIALGERFEIPEETFTKLFEVIAILQRRPESVS